MRFELSIYGEGDELIKKYETDHVRWGVFLEAVKLYEANKDKNADEQFKDISEFIKKIFLGITDEEIEKADGFDVINTFKQLVASVNELNEGNSKNA